MILVDTSIWIDHLRAPNTQLQAALTEGEVLMHSFVLGELACGNIRNRAEILALLGQLPPAREATHDEVMVMIDQRRLMGRGIGYIDAHLLAGAALTSRARLWTKDRVLARIAVELDLAHVP